MENINYEHLKDLLERKYQEYNNNAFIETDPIQIPHLFTSRENIEISAFLSSTIAWGQRKSIINNARKMILLMENDPYKYLTTASDSEIDSIYRVVHRTFNTEDFKYFLRSLRNIYLNHGGLRQVFEDGYHIDLTVKSAIIHFREIFFELPHLSRTERHIADVKKNSAAKRINMFLMWMIRKDSEGVHFGLWDKIPVSKLMLPIDVHSGNTARKLGLLLRKQNDWKAVEEVTANLRKLDADDPVKYDFALFGIDLTKAL